MKRLNAGGDDDLAGIEALRDDHLRLIESQHIDIADRNRGLVDGSTTHTAGCSFIRVNAVAGMSIIGPELVSTRPFTVAPSRMAAADPSGRP